jgi:hypothetical protein
MKLFDLFKNLFNKKPKQESKPKSYAQLAVEWLDNNPQFLDYCSGDSCHIGEINYYVKNDKTYFYDDRSKKFFCDYDVKNPSKEVLLQMIKETTFTPTEFEKDV